MLLVCPCHTANFLEKNNLGIEAFIGRSDQVPDWDRLIPFVHGIHLPYAHLNLAAFDDELRNNSISALKAAIDEGCKYPVDKMVMHTIGIELWGGGPIGNYERMIDGIKEICDYAGKKGITICVENSAQHIPERIIYGVSAEEWLQIYDDVDRSNVMLTLDTSHAAAAAAFIMKDGTDEDRFNYLNKFLSRPEVIGRVHWSDSRLSNGETYMRDMHLTVGEGDLPRDFHKRIKNLDCIKTLEQYRPENDVIEQLKVIESL